jgi:hypothetical protein
MGIGQDPQRAFNIAAVASIASRACCALLFPTDRLAYSPFYGLIAGRQLIAMVHRLLTIMIERV